jgi:hypothetical protein
MTDFPDLILGWLIGTSAALLIIYLWYKYEN